MSSAALQAPAGLPTSARHYAPSHPSPTLDGYHDTQQQPQHQHRTNIYSPNGSGVFPDPNAQMSQTNSPLGPRAAHSAPIATSALDASDYYQQSPTASSERRRHGHGPPVAPPRTSSNRHDLQPAVTTQSSSGSSRRSAATATTAADSSRRHRESRGPSSTSAAGSGSREDSSSRRRQNRQPQQQQASQEYTQRSATASSAVPSAGGATPTTVSMPIRSHPAATTAHTATREPSEILSSVFVSRDEDDIERERARMAMAHHGVPPPSDDLDDSAPPPVVPTSSAHERSDDRSRSGGRSRHDHSRREKPMKFGEYILGNTIGEGEFGKVKLGWKQEGGVQVAIKLIKKDALGSNPSRMDKIMREVNILRQLRHPNIVRLHKMEESEHHYGIVLEYASGGELFDFILKNRYLKDDAARRLFAQLVSGVGYLHKKGIVHRDLKLENLLLDQHRNIIITDFGFANTFDPHEELTEEEEANLADREFVKRMGFDLEKPNGMHKADLMQTSCGSPCYAAPELVVSDSVYTGRKVDVWSCGVILYAMLAGYLPFDDDPKNPEGDNINLLYKYIVNTPLTFPEYVTPDARDLLRRILVPNPRQRADLFEVARHSWLSEYADIVEFITSNTTSPSDIQKMPASADAHADGSMLGRSSSVRETAKRAVVSPTLGGLTTKQGTIDPESEAAVLKQQKDNKRRTVQVEYVAPNKQTQRGGEFHLVPTGAQAAAPAPVSVQAIQVPQAGPPPAGKTRVRPVSHGPTAVLAKPPTSPNDKPLPRDPPVSMDAYKTQRDGRRPPSSHRTTGAAAAVASATAPASRSGRSGSRAVAEAAFMNQTAGGRPVTGGSMASTGSRTVPNQASFGQPVPPTVAGTNAHGRIQQPKAGGGVRNYNISDPVPQDMSSFGQPSIIVPSKFAQVTGFARGNEESSGRASGHTSEGKGHRRSSTLVSLLGRSGSIFGGKGRKQEQRQSVTMEKPASSRRYPPVSMTNPNAGAVPRLSGDEPRASMDSGARQSRRSFSLGLGKKRSGSIAGSQTSQDKQHSRRFSLLPGAFSLKAIKISRDAEPDSQPDLPIQDPPSDALYSSAAAPGAAATHLDQENNSEGSVILPDNYDDMYMHLSDPQQAAVALDNASPVVEQQSSTPPVQSVRQNVQQPPWPQQPQQPQQQPRHVRYASADYERQRPAGGVAGNAGNFNSNNNNAGALTEVTDNIQRNPPQSMQYQGDYAGTQGGGGHRRTASRSGRVLLQKNKRMVDAYDKDELAKHHDHSGSSGAARRVMDIFRWRSAARSGKD